MLVVGLTGGVGMGKSAVAALLEARRVPVIDTDAIAREETEPGSEGLAAICAEFGPEIADEEGRLKRSELAAMVFGNEARRKALERILHPRIRARWRNRVERWRAEGMQQAVVVIPLLFETGAEAELNRTVCVACTPRTQMRRLRERGWTDEQARQRVAAQWPVGRKMDLADAVIWNESTLEVCELQAARVFDWQAVAEAAEKRERKIKN